MNINELFSIPVFSKSLSVDNQKIIKFCNFQKEQDIQGNILSNAGGWQSNPFYQTPNDLAELFLSIEEFSSEVCEFLRINRVKVINSWININEFKDFNWSHSHGNNILSGVYYAQTPENCGDLIFQHPSTDLMEISLSPEKIKVLNKFNSIGWKQRAESGLLCIFPGWVKHYVNPNYNERENRISISFNLS